MTHGNHCVEFPGIPCTLWSAAQGAVEIPQRYRIARIPQPGVVEIPELRIFAIFPTADFPLENPELRIVATFPTTDSPVEIRSFVFP